MVMYVKNERPEVSIDTEQKITFQYGEIKTVYNQNGI